MTAGFNEIKLEEETAGKIVTLTFLEKLEREDCERFLPQLEGLMKPGGKIRLVVELKDFRGWTAGALWEEAKFAFRHFNNIERLAIIGDRKWEKGMAEFVKPFTKALVRYFSFKEKEDAKRWVRQTSES
jgi:hypothetical protein